jgi:hypothetical protein
MVDDGTAAEHLSTCCDRCKSTEDDSVHPSTGSDQRQSNADYECLCQLAGAVDDTVPGILRRLVRQYRKQQQARLTQATAHKQIAVVPFLGRDES